jgi:hypothetical protein
MINKDFMGLNNFVWWFGVVENRIDPLNLGRCQVRCFGWHTEDISQIPVSDLPWAHPIVPFGSTAVQPPTEGTMVFGFFADGQEARYPILMGTVPGIPTELRNERAGFTDPWSAALKASQGFPKKLVSSHVTVNNAGPKIEEGVPQRYPEHLDEPTISRLARPDRVEANVIVEGAVTGEVSYSGIRSEGIANTTIDFQRKSRVVGIRSASYKKTSSVGPTGAKQSTDYTTWDEPFPSFNADYPFNNVTETESGHAFELDDTPRFERVQLSHRIGSTLEFLPSGSVKLKSFNSKYDITMGDHKAYVNGAKDEVVQGAMFLRVNGKLLIQCSGFELVSDGDIDMKGQNINLTASKDVNISATSDIKNQCGGSFQSRGESGWSGFGGGSATLSSLANVTVDGGMDAKISGLNVHITGIFGYLDTVITNILSPVLLPVQGAPSPKGATRVKTAVPTMKPTAARNRKEPTDKYSFREQQRVSVSQQKQVSTSLMQNGTLPKTVTTTVDESFAQAAGNTANAITTTIT